MFLGLKYQYCNDVCIFVMLYCIKITVVLFWYCTTFTVMLGSETGGRKLYKNMQVLTYLLLGAESPSREANSSLVSQEIPCIL